MSVVRVLLVDDELEFTTTLSKVLKRRGFDVSLANGGEAALEKVREAAFDVVLLDVKMPGQDGIAVLAAMRRIAPGTRVILMTGHLSVQEEAHGLDGGAFAYLLKPHPIDDLVARIEAAATAPA
jgi:DNA-binding response OmpR family regulator